MMSSFWSHTGKYPTPSRITKILERSDFTLEKLLDEQETLVELQSSNIKLTEYLRQPEVLEALVQYVVEDDRFQLEQKRLEEEEEFRELHQSEQQESQEKSEEEIKDTPSATSESSNNNDDDNNGRDNESDEEKEEHGKEKGHTTEKPELSNFNEDKGSFSEKHNDNDDNSASSNDHSINKENENLLDKEDEDGLIKAVEEVETDDMDNGFSDAKGENDTSESETDSDSDSDSGDLDLSVNYYDNGFDDEIDMDDDNNVSDSAEETLAEQHTRRAQLCAEILSADIWSITEAFMGNVHLIEQFWSILDQPAPLPIFSATYFMKINEHLLDMKMEDMIAFILKQPKLVERFLRHIDTPPLMDFLLKVISTDKPDISTGVIDVLKEQGLIRSLISFLGPDKDSSVQSAAGDFLKAFITISANNSDNSTIGPNELSRELVSEPVIKELVKLMLHGGTGLSNGVGIVIEIIRKNNSDYDIVSVLDITVSSHPPTPRDPIYLGTLVKVFAEAIPDFRKMLERKEDKKLKTPFGEIEPLGFERFKICELVAELLHCSNMALLNERKGEFTVRQRDRVRRMLIKEQKRFEARAEAEAEDFSDNEALSDSDVKDPESPVSNKSGGTDDEISRKVGDLNLSSQKSKDAEQDSEEEEEEEEEEEYDEDDDYEFEYDNMNPNEIDLEFNEFERHLRKKPVVGDQLKIALYDNNIIITILNMFFQFPWNNFLHNVVFDIVQQILGGSLEIGYNKYLVADLFGRGQITQFIVNGDKKCQEYEEESGLRLGYMGHLSLIGEEVVKFTNIYLPILKSQVILDAASSPEWTHYVNDTLEETRHKYNAVLGDPKIENDEDVDDEYDIHRPVYQINDPNRPDGDLSLYHSEGHDDSDDIEIGDEGNEEDDERNMAALYNRRDNDEESDQFSRYMSQQITSDLSNKFGSSDEDDDDDDLNNWNNYDYQSNKYSTISSSVGGQTYHQMGTFEPNEDDYEDPNDDGLSYAKDSHHLYASDGLLSPVTFDQKQGSFADESNIPADIVSSDSDSDNSDTNEGEEEGEEGGNTAGSTNDDNGLTRSTSKSLAY